MGPTGPNWAVGYGLELVGTTLEGPRTASSVSSATTNLSSTCTNYTNGTVAINTTSSGTMIGWANAYMYLYHVSGTYDDIRVAIGTTNTDCGSLYGYQAIHTVPDVVPTIGWYAESLTPMRAVSVSSGTTTLYLNGLVYGGVASTNCFYYSHMIAVFIPT